MREGPAPYGPERDPDLKARVLAEHPLPWTLEHDHIWDAAGWCVLSVHGCGVSPEVAELIVNLVNQDAASPLHAPVGDRRRPGPAQSLRGQYCRARSSGAPANSEPASLPLALAPRRAAPPLDPHDALGRGYVGDHPVAGAPTARDAAAGGEGRVVELTAAARRLRGNRGLSKSPSAFFTLNDLWDPKILDDGDGSVAASRILRVPVRARRSPYSSEGCELEEILWPC